MFNKTRRKIVFTVVFSLLTLMAVTFATIYLSNRLALQRENEEMLKTYVDRYSLEDQPANPVDGGRPENKPSAKPDMQDDLQSQPDDGGRMKNEPAFRLSTFYSVAYSKTGEVLAVDNGKNDLQSEDALLETAMLMLKSGKSSSTTGNMTYIVEQRESYTLVAMIDGTITAGNQRTLLLQMLIIGAIAMTVLFVASLFIAKRIVQPLEENDKRQKRFVSDAGHELKTPIAVISANSELLRRQIGDNEWLSNIDYENERMSALVKQLLELSHAENGDLPKEPIDLSQLVSGEVLPFESLAFEKGREIVSKIESSLTVEGNPNQLRQLVSILLDNALSHGSGEVIELSLHRERHFATLTVSNQAEEMDAQQVAHLFDRFYRTDEARGDTDSHYGLGLSIAKAITETHKGDIRAEYRNGKAIFTVSMPIT